MKAFKGGDSMQDKELAVMAKSGDRDAFAMLYNRYKDRLYRYAFYKLGNSDDAEDAVSDCVLSAYSQISKLKKSDAFSSWIFRILYCSCNAVIKRQIDARSNANIDDMQEKLLVSDDNAIEKTELSQALDILADDEREIVLLSVVAGFNSKEIAKTCDLTAGAVRSKLSRSLKKMRDFLE